MVVALFSSGNSRAEECKAMIFTQEGQVLEKASFEMAELTQYHVAKVAFTSLEHRIEIAYGNTRLAAISQLQGGDQSVRFITFNEPGYLEKVKDKIMFGELKKSAGLFAFERGVRDIFLTSVQVGEKVVELLAWRDFSRKMESDLCG
jgi:hypothetical protein